MHSGLIYCHCHTSRSDVAGLELSLTFLCLVVYVSLGIILVSFGLSLMSALCFTYVKVFDLALALGVY